VGVGVVKLTRRGAVGAAVVVATVVLGPRLGSAVPPADAGADAPATTLEVPPPGAGPWRPFRRNGDRPVGFDACRMIEYVVHPRHGGDPDADEAVARAAVADAAAASGLRVRFAGRTAAVPTEDDRPGVGDPLWVGWADDTETDLFAPHGDAVGVGGSDVIVDGPGPDRRAGGYAAVRTSRGGRPPGLPQGADGAVLRHELGHALGLDHVDDPGELLYGDVAVGSRKDYGPGDRRGLWELGAGQGCAGAAGAVTRR